MIRKCFAFLTNDAFNSFPRKLESDSIAVNHGNKYFYSRLQSQKRDIASGKSFIRQLFLMALNSFRDICHVVSVIDLIKTSIGDYHVLVNVSMDQFTVANDVVDG